MSTVHAQFDAHDLPFDVLWLDIEHTDRTLKLTLTVTLTRTLTFTLHPNLHPNPSP